MTAETTCSQARAQFKARLSTVLARARDDAPAPTVLDNLHS